MPFDPSQPFEEVSGFDPSKPFQEVGTAVAEPPLSASAQLRADLGTIPSMDEMQKLFGTGESEDSLKAWNPSLAERARISPVGRAIFGPTEAEKEVRIGGGAPAPMELLNTAFKFSSVPPPIADEIRTVTDPAIQTLPKTAQGVVEGLRELGLTFPIAAGGAALGQNIGRILLGVFGGEYVISLPEQKMAFDEAVKRGDKKSAAKIATQAIGGGAILAAGAAHETAGLLKPEIRGIKSEPLFSDQIVPRGEVKPFNPNEPFTEVQSDPLQQSGVVPERSVEPSDGTVPEVEPLIAEATAAPIAPPPEAAPQVPPGEVAPAPDAKFQDLNENFPERLKELATDPEGSYFLETLYSRLTGEKAPSSSGELVQFFEDHYEENPESLRKEFKPYLEGKVPLPVEPTPPVAESVDFPNKGVGSPADEFGAIYGPTLSPESMSRFEAQSGQDIPLESPKGHTATLTVKPSMLWLKIEQSPNKSGVSDVGISYLKIRPDGTTVLDASHHGRPLDKLAADTLVNFLKKSSSEKQAEVNPPKQLTPPVAESAPVETKAKQQGLFKPDRPTDIIDAIEGIGKIRNKLNSRPGHEGYYSEGYKQATAGAARKVFSKSGMGPDEMLDSLRREGLINENATVDDMWDAIDGANQARRAFVRGELPEQKADAFYTAVSKNLAKPSTHKLTVGDLNVGDKFTLQGVEMEVSHIDADTGEVTVKDGRKFASQTLPEGATLPVDKGTLEKAKKKTIPKLRTGEKGTGDLLQGQDAPFNLTGEKATDYDRLAKEQEAALKAKEEAQRLQDEQQQGFVGMGGAIPAEFENSNKTPTSTKNATVEMERAKRGLPPAIEPARRSFGRVWDEAMAIVDRDPKAQDDLIDSLRRKPRALTDTEDALLLQRQIDLQNEYGKATRDLAQAFDDGRSEAVVEEKLRVARISDQLLDLYNVGKKSGTETGRGLNARKMMANEDFTLAQMEISKRAANEGRPLSDAERAELEAAHQRIVETDKAFEDYKAKAQERIVNLELAKAAAEAKRQPTVNPYILSIAEKIGNKLRSEADIARANIKERGFRFNVGIDPTVLVDVAKIGASHIYDVGLDLAKWSLKMAEEFGEGIKPHLPEIWKASQGVIEGLKVDQKVKRAVKKQDVTEKISSDVAKIKERVTEDGKGDISTSVNILARHLIESGIKDREKLLDAIHEKLKEVIPDITRREAMDALSGYGDFRQLSKDKISIELRGIKGEMQQIAKLEDMAAGIPPRKTGMERREPTQAERELIKAVNEAKFKFQVPMTDPATQLKSALDTRKIQLKNRETDLRKKLADKEFLPKERRELQLDAEAIRLEANAKRAKEDFQRGLVLDRLSKRTLGEKFQDTFVKWRRGFLLSSPVTLAKLTSAAIQRMSITPGEELIGSAISKIIPSVAKKAAREGSGSLRAESVALADGFTKGMADAWKTLKTGRSDLDALYGKADLIPKSAIDFFGHLHGALKAPTKRNEFARSFQKRVEASLRDGVDPSDPMVQMKIAAEAYKDANRAIFQQDNRVTNAWKAALATLGRADKYTGKVPAGAKALSSLAQVALPIVKVPTNIVAETLQYSVGSITGSVRLANALRKGVDTLKPEEADLIMRQLKKGSLGAAVLLLGFLNPETIGGYYQQGDNKKKGLVKAGHARIYGVDIPSFLLHNPLLETAQIGATMRRVMDSKLKKSDTETQGIGAGIWAGALGLADEVPFVREMLELTKIWNPRERGAFTGELIKSTVVPQALQWAARQGDKNAQGNPIVRKPTTVLEHIKTGIPGLRQQVPAKP